MAYGVVASHVRRKATVCYSPISYDGPLIIDAHINSNTIFSYVDFLPYLLKHTVRGREGPNSAPFRTILTTANEWLVHHLEFEAINCETIVIPFESDNSDDGGCALRPDKCRTSLFMGRNLLYVRGLRIWIRRRTRENAVKTAQVLTYMDFRPLAYRPKRIIGDEQGAETSSITSDESGAQGWKMERLNDILCHLNAAIKCGMIEGHILCVESLDCDVTPEWQVYSQEWTVSRMEDRYARGLRLFYEKAESIFDDEIGIADFVPRFLGGGNFVHRPTFEAIEEVVHRAAQWLSMNPELTFINAQIVEVKLTSRSTIDSLKLASSRKGDQVRIVRLVYSKPEKMYSRPSSPSRESGFLSLNGNGTDPEKASTSSALPDTRSSLAISNQRSPRRPPPPAPIYLATKMFTPVRETEKTPELNFKMQNFILDSDVKNFKLLCVETVRTFLKSSRSHRRIESSFEQTFQGSRFGGIDLIYGIRIYFDEGYFNWKRRDAAIRRMNTERMNHWHKKGASDLEIRRSRLSMGIGGSEPDDHHSYAGVSVSTRSRKMSNCSVS